ncbi:hypothetical protein GEV33_003705 [Tenebrio molitor]|uniref:Uncharacterized protein n=1 Tax=Tenebrio molitor TaxID=7067 RepID=A0A8J6HSC7_TENMO|nr:hypothetical protein GEV33_003705 [Tenebrio molitor]
MGNCREYLGGLGRWRYAWSASPFFGCGGTPHGRGSFAEPTVSGGRLSGRGKGGSKQTSVATSRPLFTICTKRRCWYLVAPEPFGDGVRDLGECSGRGLKKSVARIVLPELQRFYGRAIVIITPVEMPISDINRPLSIIIFVLYLGCTCGLNLLWVLLTFIQWYPAIKPLQLWENYTYGYSGRTWTPLILPVLGGGGVERKAGWPGFPHNGKERARSRGESGMAGVPSQWEGTGRDKGEKGNGRGSLAMGRNGPGQGEKRDVRGSLTMGRNGPGQGEKSGMQRGREWSRSRTEKYTGCPKIRGTTQYLSNVAKQAAHPKFVWVFKANCDGKIIYNDPVNKYVCRIAEYR